MHLAFHCNIAFQMNRFTAEIRLSVQLMGLTPVNFMFSKTNWIIIILLLLISPRKSILFPCFQRMTGLVNFTAFCCMAFVNTFHLSRFTEEQWRQCSDKLRTGQTKVRIPTGWRNSLSPKPSRLALWPAQLPLHLVQGFFPGRKNYILLRKMQQNNRSVR